MQGRRSIWRKLRRCFFGARGGGEVSYSRIFALRCRMRALSCSHPTTQRPTTATSHIQQNQRSTPYAVTHGLCSPEDGHNDSGNMLRQKLIINIWLLHLVVFLSLHTLLTMHGHRNLKLQLVLSFVYNFVHLHIARAPQVLITRLLITVMYVYV